MQQSEGVNKKRSVTGVSILLIAIGWICAILSLFIYPFVFGVAGVIMGILATKSNNRAGLSVIVGSILLMGVGLIYSGVILNYTRHYLGF
jgi:hypothetical protein